MALILLGVHGAWVAALANASHPPRSAARSKHFDKEEPPSSESSEASSEIELVKPAQKPAPEIEEQYKNFQGTRSPPGGSVELSVERTPDDRHYRINEVDPKGPFAGKYQPGEIIDEVPTPNEINESQPKSSEGAAGVPASH